MELKRFDYRIKENKKKPLIIASIIVLILLVGATIYSTYAKYKVTESYNILQGEVNQFLKGDIKVTVKLVNLDGTESVATDFPEEAAYAYDASKSYCKNGSNLEYINGEASISDITGIEKCYLYFNERGALASSIISQAKTNNYLYTTTPEFGAVTSEGEYGLYRAADDNGMSYYFRGDVSNNYVQFGSYAANSTLTVYDYTTDEAKEETFTEETPMYWRIARINGDGTIRLVYDGTTKSENGVDHISNIGKSLYNENAGDAKYIGYTYDDGTGKQTDSTIKGVVDTWYNNHLKTNYEEYIADSIFCNDREVTSTEDSWKYYGAYTRLESSLPKLTCTREEDRYTTNEEKGNGFLTNPVGIITADELVMFGLSSSSTTNYLYNYENILTMSPYGFSGSASVYSFDFGILDYGNVDDDYYAGVRPVINLKADVTFEGNGSYNTPYVITAN